MKKSVSFYFGNLLILLSLFGLVFIFYPVIKIYLFPPPPAPAVAREKGLYLSIPKIRAQGNIIEDVDPFNKEEYTLALRNGIAHAKGTQLPGDSKGLIFLFAHSSGAPWEVTRYNTVFLRLGELERGDDIQIGRNGRVYKYKVREKKEVAPTEVNYLIDNKRNELILQTCTPIGTDLRRLLIFADPV